MNLSRNETIIAAGVILLHALLIIFSLGKTSKNSDPQDVIRAQLVGETAMNRPDSPTPPAPADLKKESKKEQKVKERTEQPKEATKTIRSEEAKPAVDKSSSTPPTPSSPSSSGANTGINAPLSVDLNQLVILYKPDTESFYPSFSKRIGEEGNVEVRLQIDENGNVQATQVTLTSGSPRLDKAAADLAQKIRFKPYTRNGVPISITAKIGVKFKLKD